MTKYLCNSLKENNDRLYVCEWTPQTVAVLFCGAGRIKAFGRGHRVGLVLLLDLVTPNDLACMGRSSCILAPFNNGLIKMKFGCSSNPITKNFFLFSVSCWLMPLL